jgi:hypothetical protein
VIVDRADVPLYLKIAEKANHLRELGMSDKPIARALVKGHRKMLVDRHRKMSVVGGRRAGGVCGGLRLGGRWRGSLLARC